MYSSTCFERPHAHHQELNNCSSSLCFYPWSVVVAVLLVVVVSGPRDHPLISTSREKFLTSFFILVIFMAADKVESKVTALG